MEEIGSIVFAHDSDHNAVHIDSADRKRPYFCPLCEQPLEIRRGEIRAHHFSHYPKDCERIKGYRAHHDVWHYEPKSKWHVDWQLLFPASMVEQRMSKDGEYHVADVLIPEKRLVIEFQHCKISLEEFEARNDFYTACGYQVVWVFDFIQEYRDKTIRLKEGDDLTGEMVRGIYPVLSKLVSPLNANVSVFFQLHDNTDKTKDCLLRITDISGQGTLFKREKDMLPTDVFLALARIKPYVLFDHISLPDYLSIPPFTDIKTGSIFELWKPEFYYMVVERIALYNGKRHIQRWKIFSNGLHPERMNTNDYGNVIGCYVEPDSLAHHGYNQRIWQSEEPFWHIVFSRNKP